MKKDSLPMNNSFRVNIINNAEKLCEVISCHIFLNLFLLVDQFQQGTVLRVLHNYKHAMCGFNRLIEPYQVRMLKTTYHVQFTRQEILNVILGSSNFGYNFDCNCQAMSGRVSQFDLCITSVPDLLAHTITVLLKERNPLIFFQIVFYYFRV